MTTTLGAGLAAILWIASGCGQNDGAGIDAPQPVDAQDGPPPPCWPVDTSTPGGTLELGTGEDGFVAMTDPLRVVYSSQFGTFYMVVNTRVTGMQPGNPADVNDPINPRTRFRAFFVDTGMPVNGGTCSIRLAYKPSMGSTSELLSSSAIVFETGYPGSMVFGRQVRIVAEIIDAAGTYATDEKTVTCAPPEEWEASDAGV